MIKINQYDKVVYKGEPYIIQTVGGWSVGKIAIAKADGQDYKIVDLEDLDSCYLSLGQYIVSHDGEYWNGFDVNQACLVKATTFTCCIYKLNQTLSEAEVKKRLSGVGIKSISVVGVGYDAQEACIEFDDGFVFEIDGELKLAE